MSTLVARAVPVVRECEGKTLIATSRFKADQRDTARAGMTFGAGLRFACQRS